MIGSLKSLKAKRVARILLDDDTSGATADEKATANEYKIWYRTNVKIGSRRVQGAAKASRRLRFGSHPTFKKIKI